MSIRGLEKVSILIPMAGTGSRFKNAGFATPKPLIQALGLTMIEWALKSFNFLDKIKNFSLIFIILEEQINNYSIDLILRKLSPQCRIICLKKTTRGQVETCLAAKEFINTNDKLFIHNCDTLTISPVWDLIIREDPDGIIPYFKSENPRYSYIKTNELGYIIQTAEKKIISNKATTGMYYFKKGKDFVNAAENAFNKNETSSGEFHIAPLYNELIKNGKKIKSILVDEHWILGTPEELNYFIQNYKI